VLATAARSTGLPRHAIQVRHLAELPMTPSGKVDYGRLRQLANEPMAESGKGPRGLSREEGVRHAFEVVLHRPAAKPTDSFTSLGGDSLSYVELAVRLADLDVDTAPGWQHLTISELASTGHPRRAWTGLDSTVVLRAAAIVLIVLQHTGVFLVTGGAHVLLAVAGYNFARFQLGRADRATLWRSRWRSLAQVMAPALLWIVAVTLLFRSYGVGSILMVEGFDGFVENSGRRLWFVEVYFWIQVVVILALAIPLADRVQRRNPFGFSLGVLAVATVARLAYTGIYADYDLHQECDLLAVAWFFAAGWAVALAPSIAGRIGITVIFGLLTFGYFQDLQRELIVFAGFAVMTWFSLLPVPHRLVRPIGMVASASLFIYVSHFQFAPMLREISPWLAAAAAIAFGIAFERAWSYAVSIVRARAKRPVLPTANFGTPGQR
jgi:hypothetical protein